VLVGLLFSWPAEAAAQTEESVLERGAELTVYLMTMGPGDYVWERFGHNAIWIQDEVRGTDIAYNYGMFSFEQDDFLLRFIRGENDYWMEGFDASAMANAYIQADRSVWAQELNLTPAQRADLRDFLEWNALPENRTYRYDYFYDNCSTRVRDAIDDALGGRVRALTANRGSGMTFRDHTRALTIGDPPIYVGLMLGLGPAVDREISLWEEMFLPMKLMEHARRLTVPDGMGGLAPLVLNEYAIYLSGRSPPAPTPRSRALVAALGGLFFGGLIILSARVWHRSRGARIGFGILTGGWSLLAGILGLVLLGLWTLTAHAASHRNENLFFVTPLLLPLAALLPFLHGRSPGWARGARAVSMVVAVGSIMGFVLQIVPSFGQTNGEIIAFALPVNLAIAYSVWRLTGPGRTTDRGRGREQRMAPARAT
jgi:hypothetical protein